MKSDKIIRAFAFFLLPAVTVAGLSGCVPGAGNTQGSSLPLLKKVWRGRYSAAYAVSSKKGASSAETLWISYSPSGRDRVLVTMVLKKGDETSADVEAYLDKKTLQPLEVNKSVKRNGNRIEVKTQYLGARVTVRLVKNKKKKHLTFDSPSKIYYDNDVFLLVLQALDFNAYLKKQSKAKNEIISVALAHPQMGHVPVAMMHLKKKKDSVMVSGKAADCYLVELSYGQMMTHRAWYEKEMPHRLVKYETKNEVFELKNLSDGTEK